MEQMICNIIGCRTILSTIPEMQVGVCNAHLDMILDENNFVGICWHCHEPTLVQSKKLNKSDAVKDRYILAKGCKRCTAEDDSIQWMNAKSNELSVTALDENGSFIISKIKEESNSTNNVD